MVRTPRALTIAGSDSGGGAGIEADLKTFAAFGVHGLVAITSVTAQNTIEVRLAYDLPPEVVIAQIEAVADDIGVDAAKTGMLSNSGIIEAVSRTVKKYGFPLVVDPVMIAKSGAPLLKPEAIDTLINKLIPLAAVVTPNKFEAERITSIKISTLDDARRAAKYIVEELGARAAVVKGGHLEGRESVDVLYYNGSYKELAGPRITDGCYHGTGCTFSAAIAAELAKGKDVVEAVKVAKEFVTTAIRYGLRDVGKGHCPVHPTAWLAIPAERWRVIEDMTKALEILEEYGELINPLIPEVQMNIVMALPRHYARSIKDVAGVLGRVVRYGKKVKAVGPPTFGASSHLARAVLKVMEFDPSVRAALNIKYSEEILRVAEKLGFRISFYDRKEEPPEVKAKEGATIPWGVEAAIKRAGGAVPDLIYHRGDVGKEPMINILGRSAVDVVTKLVRLARELRKMQTSKNVTPG
ncbi:MAG: bifunctional hydroxymethylpyrimidine kinase/phosphomethylpyrimidine kinase [Desulfurococcales archaeon]|nr:bifunctional hydroxymethylpyrimidine kinase/phosphomethylpyrimidine kinase [Desulfurococcales archaeon]